MGNFFSNWEDVEIPDELEDKTVEGEKAEDPCKGLEGEELTKCQQESDPCKGLEGEELTKCQQTSNDDDIDIPVSVTPDTNADAPTVSVIDPSTPETNTEAPIEPISVTQQQGGDPKKRRRTRKKRGNARKQTRKP